MPWGRLAVDVDNGFEPVYVIPPGKKKIVAELRKALKDADELYIATDEDREGEAIGWHLVELLKPKIPVHRMVFHEITEKAILAALNNPRDLDIKLVAAQETRRVLDRLVGYTVSPLLWRKVAPKLSAGRVQSAAVRIMVIRERERMAFKSATYWDLKATLEKDTTVFDADMKLLDGKRLAGTKDFDENTGKLKPGVEVLLLDEARATELAAGLKGSVLDVVDLKKKDFTSKPPTPFTTSTLQQEANNKLGLSAKRTMQTAQRLYENGHITYMRTDSVHLAEDALTGIRSMVEARYGKEFLPAEAKRYKTKAKGAQEAHEAIRPAGTEMPTASELKLTGEQAKLYELIWKRTVASQMVEAKKQSTTATIHAKTAKGEVLEFRSSGTVVVFPGFLSAYEETIDGSKPSGERSQPLPALAVGDRLPCKEMDALKHETKPPPRYTEAKLVKELEAQGIGRPSTYASIIDTIQYRGYVMAKNKQLVPTFIAMAVTQLLEAALGEVVDLQFTAGMEASLDEIAEGADGKVFLREFYDGKLLSRVEKAMDIDAKSICTIIKWPDGEVRVGRYGAYADMTPPDAPEGEQGVRVSLPAEAAPSEVDKELVERLVFLAERSKISLGDEKETGLPVFVKMGPFGPYVQLGEAGLEKGDPKPKRVSIPATYDPATLDFDKAVQLLALPRKLGLHPETEKAVKAGIGRFGPYVLHERVYASLKPTDDILSVELPRALELLKDKKPRRRASEPLKVLGDHPDGGVIQVMEGPFGIYVKWEKLNVGLPEGLTPEDATLEEALIWIDARLEYLGQKKAAAKKKPAKKKATKKKAPAKKKAAAKKKPAAKKAPAKKAAAKKTPAKKAPAKKAAAKKKPAAKKAPAKKKAAAKKPAVRKAAAKTPAPKGDE
jgi:DNA topoisomerase-1